jgi:16S rRNA G527 N7-methylase RsmG
MQLTSAEQSHQALLEKWRKAMDLVGPGPLAPHFEDAARAVSWIPAQGLWLDLGAGAGFPGIALAARHPQAEVQLVESRQKRAVFLEQVIRESALKNAKVLHQRSEDLAPGLAQGVISRAYKPPKEALEDAMALLQPLGIAVLLLAKHEAPAVSGMEVFHVERYEIEGKKRRAVGYRKQA